MQIKQILALFIFVLGIGTIQSSLAQTIKNNDRGERIIVFKDGSWRYFNENDPKDQALWESQMNRQAKEKENETKKDKPTRSSKKPKTRSNKKQKSSFKKSNENKSSRSDKANNNDNYSGQVLSRMETIRYAEKLSAEEARAIKEEEEIALNLFFLQEDLDELRNGGRLYDKQKEKELITKIKETKKQAKVARSKTRVLTKRANLAAKMIEMDPEAKMKTYAKLEGQTIPKSSSRSSNNSIASSKRTNNTSNRNKKSKKEKPSRVADNSSNKKSKKSKSKDSRIADNKNTDSRRNRRNNNSVTKLTASTKVDYVPAVNALYNPPAPKCNIEFDGIDEFTGKKRRDVAAKQLFAYTSDRLKPYLKEKDFITCNANVTRMEGGLRFLFLEFIINSENAQREFGMLERSSQVIITMIDGSSITTKNTKTDAGKLDSFNKTVTYNGQYLISGEQAKWLTKEEVDKIRVVWSTGFEDYTIYDVDFFIDQFNCLNSEEFK